MWTYPALFLLAFVYANFLEWVIHKYLFHGLGKNKKSIFSSHWNVHHKQCRKNKNKDSSYEGLPNHPSVRHEIFSLLMLNILHLPLLFVSPVFYLSLVYMTFRYFYIHRKSHLDVEWGKRNFPWHYDHHMGRTQDANWGVTSPLWDYIMGTRRKFINKKPTILA